MRNRASCPASCTAMGGGNHSWSCSLKYERERRRMAGSCCCWHLPHPELGQFASYGSGGFYLWKRKVKIYPTMTEVDWMHSVKPSDQKIIPMKRCQFGNAKCSWINMILPAAMSHILHNYLESLFAWKMVTTEDRWIFLGREFHSFVAATEKALSKTAGRLILGPLKQALWRCPWWLGRSFRYANLLGTHTSACQQLICLLTFLSQKQGFQWLSAPFKEMSFINKSSAFSEDLQMPQGVSQLHWIYQVFSSSLETYHKWVRPNAGLCDPSRWTVDIRCGW